MFGFRRKTPFSWTHCDLERIITKVNEQMEVEAGNAPPQQQVNTSGLPIMVSPMNFVRAKGGSFLSDRLWYRAFWEVQRNPYIKPGTLASTLSVSHGTAVKMRTNILQALHEHDPVRY